MKLSHSHLYKNHHCYELKKKIYPKHQIGIFDDVIDVCYILFYIGYPQRYQQIIKQLNQFCFCKKTYICMNKGFKHTNKILYQQKSNFDLIDSYLYVFHDAYYHKKVKKNILILEDDFIIEEDIFYPIYTNHISSFLSNKLSLSYPFIYSLGCIPHWNTNLFYFYTARFFYTTDSQANIYSNQCIKHILLDTNIYKEDHIDRYLHKKYVIYGFFIPLVTQLKNETENTKNWPNGLYEKLKPIYHYLQLHTSTKNYKLFYIYGLYKFYMTLFLFISFLYFLWIIYIHIFQL
jgi:hypothetical protein